MKELTSKDLPSGLSHLRTYWEGEEMDPDIRTKFCDGEISDDEEIRMFLEWCQKQNDLSDQDKKDLQELLQR